MLKLFTTLKRTKFLSFCLMSQHNMKLDCNVQKIILWRIQKWASLSCYVIKHIILLGKYLIKKIPTNGEWRVRVLGGAKEWLEEVWVKLQNLVQVRDTKKQFNKNISCTFRCTAESVEPSLHTGKFFLPPKSFFFFLQSHPALFTPCTHTIH